MIVPFNPLQTFDLNPDYKIVEFNRNVLVIDDWYKNFEEITNLLSNIPVPLWKYTPESKNFIDYYDCRPHVIVHNEIKEFKFYNELKKLSQKYFTGQNVEVSLSYPTNLFEYNFTKIIKNNYNPDYQFHPHTDSIIGYKSTLNCIVYIDNVSSGGTAFYPDIKILANNEHKNVFLNVSAFKKFFVKAKPNRLVIFDGSMYHGGYIEDHSKYINDWRINQVLFLKYSPL